MWICLKLRWKITTMSLIYFIKFELTASGGVEIWYPLCITRCRWVLHGFGFNKFHLRWCSWWEVAGVVACHRHFDGMGSPQLSTWEDFITIDMVMSRFCMCFACKKHVDEICSPLSEQWDFVTIGIVTSGFRDDCIEIQAGTMDV